MHVLCVNRKIELQLINFLYRGGPSFGGGGPSFGGGGPSFGGGTKFWGGFRDLCIKGGLHSSGR